MSDPHVHELPFGSLGPDPGVYTFEAREIKTGTMIAQHSRLVPGWREAEQRAYTDPSYLAAKEHYSLVLKQRRDDDSQEARNASYEAFRAKNEALRDAVGRELVAAGIILRQPDVQGPDFQDEFPTREQEVAAEVEDDPRVAVLSAKVASNPEDGSAYFALEQARGDALARINERRAVTEQQEGTVLTPDAREWLRGLVTLNGAEAVCRKHGVSEAVLTRLIDGIPTPPSWRDVPAPIAAE